MARRVELGWIAFVTMILFLLWMFVAQLLVAFILGPKAFASPRDLLLLVATTPQGWILLIVGHVVGALFSLVAFSLTLVAFPLLLDRNVDFVIAIITSVRAVATSPRPMVVWAAVVAILMLLARLPAFLGLLVVLPVLGHTTWQLYRRMVVPQNDTAPTMHQENSPRVSKQDEVENA